MKEEALDRTMWRNRFGRGFGPVAWQITDDDDDDDYVNRAICSQKLHPYFVSLFFNYRRL